MVTGWNYHIALLIGAWIDLFRFSPILILFSARAASAVCMNLVKKTINQSWLKSWYLTPTSQVGKVWAKYMTQRGHICHNEHVRSPITLTLIFCWSSFLRTEPKHSKFQEGNGSVQNFVCVTHDQHMRSIWAREHGILRHMCGIGDEARSICVAHVCEALRIDMSCSTAPRRSILNSWYHCACVCIYVYSVNNRVHAYLESVSHLSSLRSHTIQTFLETEKGINKRNIAQKLLA